MGKYNIPPQTKPKITIDEFWQYHMQQRQIKPLAKQCKDCAIGFYGEISEELLKQPVTIQNKVAGTWFCHNNCNRGCAGIRGFLKENKHGTKLGRSAADEKEDIGNPPQI